MTYGWQMLGDQYGTEHDYMYPEQYNPDHDYVVEGSPHDTPESPKYSFWSLEELVTSSVFQRQLSMALASKERQIDDLRNEILNMR